MVRNLLCVLYFVLAGTAILFYGKPAPVYGQTPTPRSPDCQLSFSLTAVGTSAPFDNRGAGCYRWFLTYNQDGLTAQTFQVNYAGLLTTNNAGTWAPFPGVVFPVAASSNGLIVMDGYYPFVSVSIVSKTGTGFIQGTLVGYREGGR